MALALSVVGIALCSGVGTFAVGWVMDSTFNAPIVCWRCKEYHCQCPQL